jgi:hypothetical protein
MGCCYLYSVSISGVDVRGTKDRVWARCSHALRWIFGNTLDWITDMLSPTGCYFVTCVQDGVTESGSIVQVPSFIGLGFEPNTVTSTPKSLVKWLGTYSDTLMNRTEPPPPLEETCTRSTSHVDTTACFWPSSYTHPIVLKSGHDIGIDAQAVTCFYGPPKLTAELYYRLFDVHYLIR